MEIVFLGTSAAIPTPERNLSAIAIRAGGTLMLWDCGEGTQRQLMHYKLGYGSIDAIFITHEHLDHCLGVYGLIETLGTSPAPKPIFVCAPNGIGFSKRHTFITQKTISKGKLFATKDFEVRGYKNKHTNESYGLILEEFPKVRFHEKKAHEAGLKGAMFQEILAKKKLKIAGKIIKLSDISYVQPGRKIVYSSDTAPCKETIAAAKNADALIHEATFLESQNKDARMFLHSTAKDAATIAKKANVKLLILTHISGRYSKEASAILEEAKKIFANAVVAHDGMKLEVPKRE